MLPGYKVAAEMIQVVDDDVRDTAVMVHDARKERNSEGPPLSQATCEVSVPRLYGQPFKPSYMRKFPKSLQVILMDEMGRRIRVISSTFWPKRVYEYKLDVDLLVFAAHRRLDVAVYGWLPTDEIKEAPSAVMSREGGEDVVAYEIERETMRPMPVSFDFKPECDHKWHGLWNDTIQAQECFKCNYHFNNKETRERWKAIS
jgi:hypothetical protein